MIIANNKVSDFKIVIPKEASLVEKTVADELKHYIGKSCGVQLEIVCESKFSGTGIFIGHTDFAEINNIKATSKENWIIKTVCGNVVLTGGVDSSDRGISYSVYHFLEDFLGVHWWNFKEEFVPEKLLFEIPDDINISQTPFADYRKVIDSFSHIDFVSQARNRMNIIGDDGIEGGAFREDVKARGGALYMGPPHQCHTLPLYFPANEYFQAHPEWWAYNKLLGKRIPFGQMCFSNEEFYDAMREKLFANIDEQNKKCNQTNTEKPYFYSITFSDARYLCECEECQRKIRKSGMSGYSLQFVNRLARDAKKHYDGVFLETLAYSIYIEPPIDDTVPESNVIIRYADIRQDTIHDLNFETNKDSLRRIKEWSSLCKKNGAPFFIWDYFLHMFPACALPQVYRLITNMKMSEELGVSGFFIENENHWPRDFWALDHWVMHRLMENPKLDGQMLIDTFMKDYYGKAGDIVKEYLELVNCVGEESKFVIMLDEPVTNWGFSTPELAESGYKLYLKAINEAADDKILEDRIKIAFGGNFITLLSRYKDFKKMKPDFDFDLKKAYELAGEYFDIYEKLYGGETGNKSIANVVKKYKKYIDIMYKAQTKNCPLPEEFLQVAKEDVYDVEISDIIRFHDGERADSIVEDKAALTGKVMKLSLDKMQDNFKSRYMVTSKNADSAKDLGFFIKKKYITEDVFYNYKGMYKEDLTPGEYQCCKLENISGITPKSNLMLYLIHQRDLAINISEICKVMPFEKCDIYIYFKVTGEHYGGKPEDENAIYFERVIVVRK